MQLSSRNSIFGGIIPIVWSDTGRKLSTCMAVLTQLHLQKIVERINCMFRPLMAGHHQVESRISEKDLLLFNFSQPKF
jgi:hypothetical protein